MSRWAMIMAGGAGTRLWPMSRREQPKQLIPFIHGASLLEVAAGRLRGVVPDECQLICTGQGHLPAVRARLPQFTEDRLLGEPCGRDTLNAVGLTAAVLHRRDPDAVFAVLTADHIIEPHEEFARCLTLAFDLVEAEPMRLVTFGITPTFPATGYGYVQLAEAVDGFEGAHHTGRFVEKPDQATAQSYLDSGDFAWNSGMFVFSAATVLDAIGRFAPEARAGLDRIAMAWDDAGRDDILNEIYPTLPKISVDYGLMEPASADDDFSICTIPMGVTWLDVGSWPSYGETLDADESGNRTHGDGVHIESSNVLAVSEDPEHVIATLGCDDLVIVHTDRVTLVCPKDRAQDVKMMVDAVAEDRR